MSVKILSWVWDNSTSRGIDRLVLLAIADSADDSGGNAWPSTATLAAKAAVDQRTVQRSIRRLVESGELRAEMNAGRNGTNVYTVTLTPGTVPPPAERHPGTESRDPRQSATGGVAESRQTPGTVPPEPSLPVLEPSKNRPGSARGTRLPADWYPDDELVQFVKTECPNVDGRAETANFIDHWHSTTRNATKLDWSATYRKWMRTEQQRATRYGRPASTSSPRIATADQRVADGMALAQRLANEEQQQRLEIGA